MNNAKIIPHELKPAVDLRDALTSFIDFQMSEPGNKARVFDQLEHMMRSCDFALHGCECNEYATVTYDFKRESFRVYFNGQSSYHERLLEAMITFIALTDH